MRGRRLDEAFPLALMLQQYDWKLQARLPEETKKRPRDRFLLFVDNENFESLKFVHIDDDELEMLQGDIEMNEIAFVKTGEKLKWNQKIAKARIVKKAGYDFRISRFEMRNLKCSSGIIQEFLNFSLPYIDTNGLTSLVLRGLPEEILLDPGAIREILRQTELL